MDEAWDFTRHAKEAGADAVLHVTPYYNKPTQEGLYQHFKAVHDCAEIPVVIYNIPGRSVVDMTVETMARLAELPRSEARRVGKECVSTCRSRWSRGHYKKKKQIKK